MRTGIALLNFGGPWTLRDVKPFLYRLFANPSVLVGVPAPLRQALAFTIAQVKGPSSVESYRSIGGGSPQLMWTEEQAEGLRRLLKSDGGDAGGRSNAEARVEIGMRSAEPSIESALRNLKGWGAERLVLLPLFPHFSTTTTGTCLEEAAAALARLGWSPPTREVRNWPDEPAYAALLRRTVDEAIARAEEERGEAADPIHVLLSAHSLPLKIVERGDTYPEDIARTIEAVTKDLKHPWSLCFQSRNGKMAWLEPYLEDELRRLGRAGVRRVVVAPVSFVSDHIETLFELDQLYAARDARRHTVLRRTRRRTRRDTQGLAHALRRPRRAPAQVSLELRRDADRGPTRGLRARRKPPRRTRPRRLGPTPSWRRRGRIPSLAVRAGHLRRAARRPRRRRGLPRTLARPRLDASRYDAR